MGKVYFKYVFSIFLWWRKFFLHIVVNKETDGLDQNVAKIKQV